MADLPPPPDLDELFDCDALAQAGAAFGQVASRRPEDGVAIGSARFAEFATRVTALHVPGLFRLDLETAYDTLRVYFADLTDGARMTVDQQDVDGLRPDQALRPSETRALAEFDGLTLVILVSVVSVIDAETGGAYLSSRAAIRPH